MVDRRQLATRYAVQVECAINVDNKMLVVHTLFSHPFLIAITNDQTEPLLHSIFWPRLLPSEQFELSEKECEAVPWGTLKYAIAHFVKAQLPSARALSSHELRHIQAMLLVPRLLRCSTSGDFANIECTLFGSVKSVTEDLPDLERIRNRLLLEDIRDEVEVEKAECMTNHPVSLLDLRTTLNHSIWQWMFKCTEMVLDVGHKLCPSPVGEKKSKGTKTLKQMAAAEDYQTMLSLFNKGYLTMTSVHSMKSFIDSMTEFENNILSIRFCDENAGYLSFMYNDNADTPKMGSISGEQIKDFKQGLPEVLMDESYPAKYSRMMRIDPQTGRSETTRKTSILHSYRSLRQPSEGVMVQDETTTRVNPLTGDPLRGESSPSVSSPSQSPFNQQGFQSLFPPSTETGSTPPSSSADTIASVLNLTQSPLLEMLVKQLQGQSGQESAT